MNSEASQIPLIICPVCKVNVPALYLLQYTLYKPLPIILIHCSCSNYTISFNSISMLYSKQAILQIDNEQCYFKEIKDKKYIDFSILLNEIQELFNQIIEYLDLSSNDNDNFKIAVIEIQKKFNFIYIEMIELYQKLLIDSMNNKANEVNNYKLFSFDSIRYYKKSLLLLALMIKSNEASNKISEMIMKINHFENNFIVNPMKENQRNYKHYYCSLGGWKQVVNWKINHYSKLINYPSKHDDSVECICELNNGNIVTCGHDKIIQIWNREKMSVIKILKGHTKPVLTIIQLRNGLLASGSSDNFIRLWNVETGECLKILERHLGNVIKLIQLSNDLLVSCSGDTSLGLWNIDNDTKYSLIGHDLTVESVDELDFNEEGDIILASSSLDRRIIIWNVATRSIIKTLFNESVKPLLSLIKLKDGKILSGSQSQMFIWDWKESELLFLIDKGAYCFIQISNAIIATGSNDNFVKIYSYPEMNLITVLSGHESTVISLALLADGNIISSSWDSTFKIWE